MAEKDLNRKMERIDSLVSSLEACPDPKSRAAARELMGTLMEFHGAAIQRMLSLICENAPEGQAMVEKMAEDPVIQAVLLLYGMHPLDAQARVELALEKVRPSLHAHKGDVELVSFDENKVRLKLIGTCNGCPSSTSTFRNLLENAIMDLAPEVESIEVDGMAERRSAA